MVLKIWQTWRVVPRVSLEVFFNPKIYDGKSSKTFYLTSFSVSFCSFKTMKQLCNKLEFVKISNIPRQLMSILTIRSYPFKKSKHYLTSTKGIVWIVSIHCKTPIMGLGAGASTLTTNKCVKLVIEHQDSNTSLLK